MRQKKIVIGNWKMNPLSLKDAEKLFIGLTRRISRIKKTEIVVCPPYLYLERLKKFSRKIVLGAQDAFWEDAGAFTGEVSGEMVYNLGVRYVILGHSERRELGETDGFVNKKIKSALKAGLVPILCVGEKERDANHEYFSVIKSQVERCLKGVSKNLISKIVIAYEPVWAISSTANRHDATSVDSREMAIFIRKTLSDASSPEIAAETRIIYGGSVNMKSAKDFLENGGIDGLLPGKASLDAEEFTEIVKICEALKN